MSRFLVAFIVLLLGQGSAVAQTGDPQAGKTLWEGANTGCRNCHGGKGIAPKDRQTYTITLSRAGTATDNVRGSIRWTKPAVKTGPFDSENIAPAPVARSTQ